jgi:hypothetical protein
MSAIKLLLRLGWINKLKIKYGRINDYALTLSTNFIWAENFYS